MTINNNDLVEEALDAFWSVIARRFPQAKYGDLSPLTSVRLDTAAETAVDEWIRSNVPASNRIAAPTPGPWYVDRQSPTSAICIKPYPGRIVCDIVGTDDEAEANALLIASLPDLRRASHTLYNEIQSYLIDVADAELPEELVAAFDEMEAVWHKMDGTQPEPAGES